MKALVAYASVYGSTGEVAEFIGRILRTYSVDVTVKNVTEVDTLKGFDLVIMGSAVHAGMWLPPLSQFTVRFETELKSSKNYMFLTCIRVLEEDSETYIRENYLYLPAMQKLEIDPQDVGIFAGKLQHNTISGDEKWMLAVQYDGTEMPGRYDKDYRDWAAITKWMSGIITKLEIHPDFDDDAITHNQVS